MTIYKENALIWWRGIGWSSDWRPAGLVLFPSVEKIVLTEGLRGVYAISCGSLCGDCSPAISVYDL